MRGVCQREGSERTPKNIIKLLPESDHEGREEDEGGEGSEGETEEGRAGNVWPELA